MEGRKKIKYILPVLFDVKPVDKTGNLDLGKIKRVRGVLDLRDKFKTKPSNSLEPKKSFSRKRPEFPLPLGLELEPSRDSLNSSQRGQVLEILDKKQILKELEKIEENDRLLEAVQVILKEEVAPKPVEKKLTRQLIPPKQEPLKRIKKVSVPAEIIQKKELPKDELEKPSSSIYQPIEALTDFYFPEAVSVNSKNYFPSLGLKKDSLGLKKEKKKKSLKKIFSKSLLGFVGAGLLLLLLVPGAVWVGQALGLKEEVIDSGLSAYSNLLAAQEALEGSDWQTAQESFQLAHFDFLQAQEEVKKIGQTTLNILKNLPGGSKISSGTHLIKVGQALTQAGHTLTSAISLFSFQNLFESIDLSAVAEADGTDGENREFLTDMIALSQGNLEEALRSIQLADKELVQVKVESLPINLQQGVASLKEKLPLVGEILSQALDYSKDFLEVLGHHNPRQYLLIFQNNSEIRATGGFIGTYGLLVLDRGEIKELFVDGVFNADGQLHEKVVPPRPIQKISTAWSMHDANWFADFPTSAKKIAWFYEKTGGPTVDGVISLTPVVVERLLEITGPIYVPEHEVTLDKDNFVEVIQYKVEVDYDKILNRPKQILVDFAPRFTKAIDSLSSHNRKKVLEIIFDCFKEKHILVYFSNSSLEELAISEGWSGQLLSTEKDYLSVVSSNINGFKTDKVIKEEIRHEAEIETDGSVTVSLTITREHQGGGLEYDWWNRVNSNYLRVYLPQGTQLISARGHTLETYQPPINYQESNFKIDSLVSSIEDKMIIDKKTGTHIFEENNKTVFGNWVYVSPGRKVTVNYKYRLPFKIDLTKAVDSYSLLVQKQSGSLGSEFYHQLKFPDDWQVSWKYPQEADSVAGLINFSSDLRTDRFMGVTFEK